MPLGIYSSVALIHNAVIDKIEVGDNASIEVRREDTGALASIFSDRAGGSGLANPFTADAGGRFEFYAAGLDQGYRVKVTKGADTHTLNNQAVGTSQERDITDKYFSAHIGGQAIDEEIIFDGLFFDQNVTIVGVDLYAREAPAGAALTLDFLKDQAEQTKIITLADGVKKQNTTIAGLTYTPAQELGLKVKSVGSTNPGAEIAIVVHYKLTVV